MAVITIGWTDATGAATLSNLKTDPGNRLSNWTPAHRPVGPAAYALGTGLLYMFEFRNDETVSFELRSIPNTELAKMLRLQLHLRRGGTVTLTTDNVLFADFVTCTLAPDTQPEIVFSDTTFLEYTFAVTLLAGSSGVGSGGSGGGGVGGGFSPINIPDLYLWLKADEMTSRGYVNNDVVDPWFDSSGFGNDADSVIHVPLTPNLMQLKTNIRNGLPAIFFNANTSAQGAQGETPTIPAAPARSIFLVAKRVGAHSGSANYCAMGNGLGCSFWETDYFPNPPPFLGASWSFSSPSTELGGFASYWTMLSIVGDAGTAQLYRAGSPVGTTFNPGDNLVNAGQFIVGGYSLVGGNNAACYIGEAIVYNRELSAAQIIDVHGYLNTKWALGL